MSLTWSAINDGRGGEETFQENGTTIMTRSKQWRVSTGVSTTDDVTIMADAGAPKIGSAHPNHANCKCIRRSCRPESPGQKLHWIFTAEYSTRWPNLAENPLNDPAVTEWTTETFQRPIWKTIAGEAIVNSAGDPYDPPPEKDDSRWVSVTKKNIANAVPDWIFSYQDAVNSDAFTIDGESIAAGRAKISAIHLGDTQERNSIQYRTVTVTIHYRGENEALGSGSGSYGSGSGGDEIDPWDLDILDAGLREWVPSASSGLYTESLRKIRSGADGLPVTAPVPLDGEGHKLEDPTPDTEVFLQFKVYRDKSFAAISSIFT